MPPQPGSSRTILFLITTLAFCGSAAALAQAPPHPSSGCRLEQLDRGRPLRRTIAVGGVTRDYLLDVPDNVVPEKPVPLLLDFHGFGHSADGVWKVSRFRELAARDGFVTVYPDGLPVTLGGHEAAGWEIFSVDGNRDVQFVKALLDEIERSYCIDLNRVYATGFSNGAFLSAGLACVMPERFAAIAPVGGGRITVPCETSRPVSVLIHHGRKDERIPVSQARAARDAWAAKNGCGGRTTGACERYLDCRAGAEVVYCEDDSGHHWPLPASERIWDFFRAHAMQPNGGRDARPDHPRS